ncbi:alkaline phosphatase family protein [Maribacter algarum]|uniref:Alkaline phosphatase family protein n=1 Tax=Maribacter algarum (ex Zhang et al. 2020) TaxID=2578118 RepID=A0A5S3PHV7_9FLAO|nr:alkaline phosphatase D family protein [Maribacter algarum]TMM53864.1 alkaline phosphatase family protein [Maribacter algarum]
MLKFVSILSVLFLFGCKTPKTQVSATIGKSDFTIAFGSCNKHDLPNLLWDDVKASNPDVWIWGGDIVYADTDDMTELRRTYAAQNEVVGYKDMKSEVPVIGSWDDHDYGLNDGGVEFSAKQDSQQELLNFLDVPKNSPRRKQEGVYTSHHYRTSWGTVSVIVLDTRYFRTAITPDTETNKRLKPNTYGEGSILGEVQWEWLAGELANSSSDFNVVISSIQFLSNEHGFECWGNFPHEVDRFNELVADSKAKGVIVLSGDRHISEFSKTKIEGMNYPLIDFTSSGLTHAYSKFSGEPNPFRVGEVVSTESFGVLEFDFDKGEVVFKMMGDGGAVLGELRQSY